MIKTTCGVTQHYIVVVIVVVVAVFEYLISVIFSIS